MIKWAQFPFLRITLAFMAGILVAYNFEIAVRFAPFFFLAGVCGFALLFMVARKRRSSLAFSIAGVTGLLCFTLAGFALTHIRSAKNDPQNLVHQTGEVTHYVGRVNDFLLDKPTVFQTVLQLEQVKMNGRWQPAKGNIQVSFRKGENAKKPGYGEILLVKGAPKRVPLPLNPGQFDYRKYLATQQIYHQHYLNPGQFQVLGRETGNPVKGLSIRLRQNLDLIFQQLIPERREYGIASALVLGVKDQLDSEIKATYTNTGTMHVLAVSGLHVGLVFLILSFGLKQLSNTTGQRLFSAAVVLSVVWSYAFITALSPSVLRAAVMFTFVVIAQVMVRKTNIYNTLAAAAFVLHCYDPFYLFEVGFQLSFVAVLAIVYLQPRLIRLYDPRTWLGRKVWTLVCISVAAQIGTFPLSLYYFHQFPVYFLLSNLIAVPMATIILYAGFAVLAFGWIPVLGFWLGKLMWGLLWLMNESMMLLEKLPLAQINRIPVTGFQTVLISLFILLVLVFMARPKLKFLMAAAGLLLIFSVSQVKETFANSGQNRFVILAVPRQSVWGFIRNQEATILADPAFFQNKQAIAFTLEPIFQHARTSKVTFQPWQEPDSVQIPLQHTAGGQLVVWQGLKIVALEESMKGSLKTPLQTDVLVLRKNVWITPEKLKTNFQPEIIVFDSSNESWYVRWFGPKLTAAGFSFHDVNTQGAYSRNR